MNRRNFFSVTVGALVASVLPGRDDGEFNVTVEPDGEGGVTVEYTPVSRIAYGAIIRVNGHRWENVRFKDGGFTLR